MVGAKSAAYRFGQDLQRQIFAAGNTDAWKGIPKSEATVLNNTIEGVSHPCDRAGRIGLDSCFNGTNHIDFKIRSKIVNT